MFHNFIFVVGFYFSSSILIATPRKLPIHAPEPSQDNTLINLALPLLIVMLLTAIYRITITGAFFLINPENSLFKDIAHKILYLILNL